jgi:transcription elongation GreA/GreB family factor/very-short-patch-repair endonuclease
MKTVEALQDLVQAKIENLRPRLLDLSRRNPLISTKLGPRSNSHLRAVDELPDVIFFKLSNGQEMDFVPLPPIEEDPRDERTDAFREAVINARLTDESYIAAMEAVDRNADDYLDETRTIERALKDRVRAQLGMAPRVQRSEINLSQHAKNNGILPSYELPAANDKHEDGRHTDDKIQTLLLPSDLERKLNAIASKSRTWIQETGMNVLQVAFGFLEWKDDDQADNSFAPLILVQVDLKKTRTPQGPRYSIVGTGDEPELNAVLAEKLRIEFSVEIPKFNGSSIETYLADVAQEVLPKRRDWRVRRQLVIGVFPSARMAMYHDLDPKQPRFPKSDIVQSLLAGSESAGALPFADEYEVDQRDIEAKVPVLVMDADSSQFSALVDIADGKNLAVEGPPGTGKSQTIVNAIAAALANNRKVLFVAEKLAALNVVKSRLEAVGLGEFLLPLQAEKSTREQVIESIKARLEVRSSRSVRDYHEKLEELRRIREQLANYIDLITSEFDESGLTVHAILGKSIATNDRLSGIANETLERCTLPHEMQTAAGLSALLHLGSQIETAHAETAAFKPDWKDTLLVHPDRFTVEEACSLAKKASEETLALAKAREGLAEWGISENEDLESLERLKECVAACGQHLQRHSHRLLLGVLRDDGANMLASFLNECAALATAADQLTSELSDELNEAALQKVLKIEEIYVSCSLNTIDDTALAGQLEAKGKSSITARAISAALEPLVGACEAAESWVFDDIAKANDLCREAGREALARKNAKHTEDNAAFHLNNLCEEGIRLQRVRASLAERVNLSVELPLDTLVAIAATLRTAGIFAFFSSRYRAARRLFKSISRSARFSKEDAVQCLDELTSFRRKSDVFVRLAEASGLFGLYYRGIDTDYEPYQRIARYFSKIADHFGGSEQATLRAFLCEAPVNQLDLLPGVPSTGVPLTFAFLRSRLNSAASEIAVLEGATAALKPIAGILRSKQISLSELQDLKRRLEELFGARAKIDNHLDARELLGDRFDGHRTRVDQLRPLSTWAQSIGALAHSVWAILSRGDPIEAFQSIDVVLSTEIKLRASLARLADVAKIDPACFMSGRTLSEAADALESASSDGRGLFAFAAFTTALQEAKPLGIEPLVQERLRTGPLIGLGVQIEALAIRRLAKAVFAKLGSKLTKYRGRRLDELRAALAEKDKEIIQLSRRQLRSTVIGNARPPRGNGVGRKSTWTNMALIENEISKKQKFIPVRELTQRAGEALIELKPCWMMSPLAVAQYVPKGSIQFDLCIIDEASQMPPESAIGALLRCSQAVVVGDTNQLPPSSFFKTLVDDEEVDEDEAVLNESVLEMANGSFRPARRLRWHYRSRHSGLIKFSNRLVYDDTLIVFPAATESLTRMGVEFKAVKGRYKAGTNPIEAKAIIEAVVEFMRTDPDRSLGVVTLNQKQRDLIMEEFEYTIAGNRAVQSYIDTWKEKNDGLEEFFIKNLENVQGDERDVIYIGTVYGAEEPGARVMQRFGPINGLAGKRRLNVLFTRAKQKIVTFSSMTAADIEAEENGNQGAYMLKRWLEYVASGILDSGEITEREPDSDFEAFVIDQIKAIGCVAVPQVGVAGYFVDIGVRHPEWPHGFILGVECDGATYHSAKSARDRDRLRQEILEGLGWKLHRIWSTDWFNNPRQEAERLRQVIVDRLAELKLLEREFQGSNDAPAPAPTKLEERLVDEDPHSLGQEIALSQIQLQPRALDAHRVEVGDTVRFRYLTDDKKIIRVTISKAQSDASRGIIHYRTPVASALLGAEEGDEVEVLIGSYIRSALIESISKSVDAVSRDDIRVAKSK